MTQAWIAERMRYFDSSGIRKVFDLAGTMTDPVNLSIGQPDFEVPAPIQEAAIAAIRGGRNGYSVTQGAPALREKLQRQVDAEYGHQDRRVFVVSGASGGLALAVLALVNPGDEVLVFDPYFVTYRSLAGMVGGRCVLVDLGDDFRIDLDKVRAAITPRTKLIIFNSPANPTGVVATADEACALAELAAERNIVLLSDEIYRAFCYAPFVSPARYNRHVLVIDGFSKTYGVTGWRVGFAHGPRAIIEEMIKLQQYTFVCAPHPLQQACATALDVDVSPLADSYRRKRDMMADGLRGCYDFVEPRGAFYFFPRTPWGTGTEFVQRAIEHQLLVIPGNIFSRHDTHFRISYAAPEATLERGIEILRRLAAQGPRVG